MSKKKPTATYKQFKEFIKSLHLKNDAEFREYIGANGRGEIFFNKLGMRCPLSPYAIPYYKLKEMYPEYVNFDHLVDKPSKQRSYPSQYKSANQVRRFILDNIPIYSLEDWDSYCELSRNATTDTIEFNTQIVPVKPVWVPEDIAGTYGAASIQYSISWFFNVQPTERIEHPRFVPYETAREFARKLGLASAHHWSKYVYSQKRGKRYKSVDGTLLPPKPSWVPGLPESVYTTIGGWVSWKDFLGEVDYQKVMPFEEAREFVRSLHLCSFKEYRAYYLHSKKIGVFRNQFDEVCELPPNNLPSVPHNVYPKYGTWTNYADFLGKADNKIKYMSYDEAKEYIVPLELSNATEWQLYIDMTAKYGTYVNSHGMELPAPPATLHTYPAFFYRCRSEWRGWNDFLRGDSSLISKRPSTRALIKRVLWTYEEARTYVRLLRLNSVREYAAYINCEPHLPFFNSHHMRLEAKPELLPKNTSNYYMEQFTWVSWTDFLGLSIKQDVPYEDCKYYALKFGITKKTQWVSVIKEHALPVPVDVEGYYRVRGKWISWNDLLGIVEYELLPYNEAKTYISSLNLSSIAGYSKWWKENKPAFLPPNLTYYSKCDAYNVSDMLGLTLTAKIDNIANDISVFYIAHYPDDPLNVISISVDSYGKSNALHVVKCKHQTVVAMFDLFGRVDVMRTIVNRYCDHYTNGESNQYVTYNLNQLLYALRVEFHETQIYKSVTIDRVNADSLQYI